MATGRRRSAVAQRQAAFARMTQTQIIITSARLAPSILSSRLEVRRAWAEP
jgi:hypothetical protein